MWGKGIYFATNASYSCPTYSFKVPGYVNVYEVFLAYVIIGNEIDTGTNNDNKIMEPPAIPNK